MDIKFKNEDINTLVKSIKMYGNLLLNDVATDADGNIITKKEKERKDGKVSRSYYNASLLSLENLDASRVVTMWQAHTDEGKNCMWKVISPKVAAMTIGQHLSGKIAVVELTEEYKVGDNFASKTTLFIPHDDNLENILGKFLVDAELMLEPEKAPVVN